MHRHRRRPPGRLIVPDARDDERVRDLPPVTLRAGGRLPRAPRSTDTSDQVIGALCVFGPEPREWSDNDVATLRQLADSVVTELELSALVRRVRERPAALGPGDRRGRHRHLRLGPASPDG